MFFFYLGKVMPMNISLSLDLELDRSCICNFDYCYISLPYIGKIVTRLLVLGGTGVLGDTTPIPKVTGNILTCPG